MNRPMGYPIQRGGRPRRRGAGRAARLLPAALLLCVAGAALLAAILLKTNAWGLTASAITQQSLPRRDDIAVTHPERFLLTRPSRFETQGKNQCAAYAAAYLLRFLGEETDGAAVYEQMNHKLSTGYVLPEGITEALAAHGRRTALVRGDLGQLKTRVSGGTPVIVLIGRGRHWQHYLTVVGYDAEQIYLYDTLVEQGAHPVYNRAMATGEFEEQWENGIPFFERIYFVIEPDQ